MSVPVGGPGDGRRDGARAKAAQFHAQEQVAARRRRTMVVAAAVVLVAALAIGVTLLVKANHHPADQADAGFGPTGVVAVPAPADSRPAAKNVVTIRTYFDYMCPYCNNFEKQTDAWQQSQVKAGRVKREFVPVSYLDRSSNGSRYSTRASSAAYAVATADAARVHDFTAAMFASQPEEGTSGMTNDQILAIAKKYVPHNATMDGVIKAGRYQDYATRISDQASKDGVSATPTVLVNGKRIDFTAGVSTLDALKQAVAAAQKQH